MRKEQIKQVIEEILKGTEFFLVDLSVPATGQLITAYVDSDQGITISQCGELSRKFGKELDERDLGDQTYNLEVSSPGLQRSLVLKRQYKKNVGRNVEVMKKDGTSMSGKLVYVDEDKILIHEERKPDTEEMINFSEISKAQVVV
ncbi:MAG: hypothetical protein WD077_00145 [Bacteroidia bacterium]